MPVFSYRALDPAGNTVTGEAEAADRKGVLQRLQRQGLKPVAVQVRAERAGRNAPAAARTSATAPLPDPVNPPVAKAPRKLRAGAAANLRLTFLQRLVELLGSGLPLGDAVRLLHLRLRDPALAGLAGDLWKQLSEGRSLSGALSSRPDLFPVSIIHLIEAGEASANLVPILHRLVAHEEAMAALRRKVTASLAYPVMLCFVAFLVIILFLYFILPQIRQVLDSLGGEVGLLPRILIGGSELILKLGPFGLAASLAAFLGIQASYQTENGRLHIDRFLLRLPLLGSLFIRHEVLRFGALLGTLLESGVNTTEALRLAERTISNRELRRRFNLARQQIQEGVAIAAAFRTHGVMPDLAADILAVGENTGSINNTRREVCNIYQRELEARLNLLTQVLGGVAFGVAFGLVALISFSILTSIVGVSQSLRAR